MIFLLWRPKAILSTSSLKAQVFCSESCQNLYLKGKFTQNESLLSGSVWGAESNGEGPKGMRSAVLGI